VKASSVLHRAKWLCLKSIDYVDPNGVDRTWETAERTTRREGADSDGAEMIAIVHSKDKQDQLVVVSQFRPPVGKHVLEFSAGLLDDGETIEESALRELKEETGYGPEGVNVVSESSPAYTDPGLTNACSTIVHLHIDGDLQSHLKPIQKLEENEFIEVILFPLDNLLGALTEYRKQHDCEIDAKLYTFAYGLHLSRHMRDKLNP